MAGVRPVRERPRQSHPEAARPRRTPHRAAQAAAVQADAGRDPGAHHLRRHQGLRRRAPDLGARPLSQLVDYFRSKYPSQLDALKTGGKLSDEIKAGFDKGIREFNEGFTA
jgi:hypothetical protein